MAGTNGNGFSAFITNPVPQLVNRYVHRVGGGVHRQRLAHFDHVRGLLGREICVSACDEDFGFALPERITNSVDTSLLCQGSLWPIRDIARHCSIETPLPDDILLLGIPRVSRLTHRCAKHTPTAKVSSLYDRTYRTSDVDGEWGGRMSRPAGTRGTMGELPPRPVFTDRRSTSIEVHKHLRDLILDSTLPPGTVLKQAELARQFGTSRAPPLREAFRMLQEEGLIEADLNQAGRVRALDANELDQLYGARIALESLGVRVTTGRLTTAEATRAQQLLDTMEQLRPTTTWLGGAKCTGNSMPSACPGSPTRCCGQSTRSPNAVNDIYASTRCGTHNHLPAHTRSTKPSWQRSEEPIPTKPHA